MQTRYLYPVVALCLYSSLLLPGCAEANSKNKPKPEDKYYIQAMQTKSLRQRFLLLSSALKDNPNCTNCLLARAKASYNLGQHATALKDLRQLTGLAPDNYEAHLLTGMVWRKLGKPDIAIAEYKKCIELAPKMARAYGTLANVYEDLGDYKKAIEYNGKAIAMEPKNALWRHNRATVYNHMGKYNLAVADIDAGIKLLPKYGALYLEKVASLYNLGKYKDALVAAQKAVKLMPSSSSAYENLGKVYLKSGELLKAKESFDKAITYNNKNTDAYNNRARIYIKLGNLKAAIADLDKSISVNPKSRSAFQMRGEIFMKLGNEEQALQDFDRSKQLLADLTRSSEAPSEKTLKDIRQGYTLAIDKKTNSGAAYYDRGCINFCLANYKSASDDFGQYTSAKGAGEKAKVRATIFRIIAEMLDGNTVKAEQLLKTIGSSSRRSLVDMKTIEYLSGKITDVELLKTSSTQADRTSVHFVVGCFNLAKKKSAAAKQHLTWVVKNGDKRMDEYLISLCEMNHKRFIYL